VVLASAPEEMRAVLLAKHCARVLWPPCSTLATHRMVHEDTATSLLGHVLGLG
jgi:hypothetical protein